MWGPEGYKGSEEENRAEKMKYLLIRGNNFESKNQLELIYYYILMKILIILLLAVTYSYILQDKIDHVPGYPEHLNFSVYSGYLDLGSPNRAAFYVFVQSAKGPGNNDPLTLWLNGGPGCSSLIGFLQEIGPYYLEDGKDYQKGDNLTQNKHSWHFASNLLFLESPAGVGFSYNNEKPYENNDINTAKDNMKALLSFFSNYTQFKNRPFWIAGESYAGKYIPDLAVQIDNYNDMSGSKIDLRGILVGNGVMSFQGGSLQNSQAQYMVDRHFIDPEIIGYWKTSCQFDPDSAGCIFFHKRFSENVEEINPYNVYGYCYYNGTVPGQNGEIKLESQQSLLMKRLAEQNPDKGFSPKFNGAPCSYFTGMLHYFNLNSAAFHALNKTEHKWNGPCAQGVSYHIDLKGSMASYRHLLSKVEEKLYQIVLYNGDWDDVVPYVDTLKNIKALNLKESYRYKPWFTDDQHSGFEQIYGGLLYLTVKGASHQVPQAKRAQAYDLFNATVTGHVGEKHRMEKADIIIE